MVTAGEHFARALAAKDSAALCALLADPVDFQALTPGRHWQATTGRQVAAEHVEMTGAVVVRDEVHPRLDHHAPVAVGPHGILYRVDDLGVREPERVDVRPGQEPDPQSSRRGHVSDHLPWNRRHIPRGLAARLPSAMRDLG